jgi:hypothetical protein
MQPRLEETVGEIDSGPNFPFGAVGQYVIYAWERENIMHSVRINLAEVIDPAWESEFVALGDQERGRSEGRI